MRVQKCFTTEVHAHLAEVIVSLYVCVKFWDTTVNAKQVLRRAYGNDSRDDTLVVVIMTEQLRVSWKSCYAQETAQYRQPFQAQQFSRLALPRCRSALEMPFGLLFPRLPADSFTEWHDYVTGGLRLAFREEVSFYVFSIKCPLPPASAVNKSEHSGKLQSSLRCLYFIKLNWCVLLFLIGTENQFGGKSTKHPQESWKSFHGLPMLTKFLLISGDRTVDTKSDFFFQKLKFQFTCIVSKKFVLDKIAIARVLFPLLFKGCN